MAASLVRPGQTVVIEGGTTVQRVARFLPSDFSGAVTTCSLLAAVELVDRLTVGVLVRGGAGPTDVHLDEVMVHRRIIRTA
jgi:DeoR/GlpR family transcriptional regulator of sugar metabolism